MGAIWKAEGKVEGKVISEEKRCATPCHRSSAAGPQRPDAALTSTASP